MPLIRPFPGLRPDPRFAGEIIAPPYDVLSTEEARDFARDRPRSFLHVSKPEIDLPVQVSATDPQVYQTGARNFRGMIEQGLLQQDQEEHLYVYRLDTDEGHSQTGLVVTLSVDDYTQQRIKRHEYTRPDKEEDRVKHMEALGAQTGPALMVHRDNDTAATLLAELSTSVPVYSDLPLQGVRHSLWPVREPAALRALIDTYSTMESFYIADGHHRTAAAERLARARGASVQDAASYFLAVLFPAAQMRILDYNRVVSDLNGMSSDRFLDLLRDAFEVAPQQQAVRPQRSGEFGLYLEGGWYRLVLRRDPGAEPEDPYAALDVARLSRYILEPLLDIVDPRRDPRIDFVGGSRGLKALEARVDSGEMAAAFSLFPTPLSALMAVADAGEIMPPKSTWFEPKLADGLVSHMID